VWDATTCSAVIDPHDERMPTFTWEQYIVEKFSGMEAETMYSWHACVRCVRWEYGAQAHAIST
jgi:hypothetical protein